LNTRRINQTNTHICYLLHPASCRLRLKQPVASR
jgi:hypothetical protein